MENKQCFVCGNSLTTIRNGENNWRSSGKTGGALLENNLQVVFLLRRLVQVPSFQLECQLRESGDNPEKWISLCDQCVQLIEKARELDEEIQRFGKRLRLIKKQVLGKMKESGFYFTPFEMKIRSFVKNYGCNELDDEEGHQTQTGLQMEGDKLAKYLESKENNCAAAIVLVEKPGEDEIKKELEYSSTPTSPLQDDRNSSEHLVDNGDGDDNLADEEGDNGKEREADWTDNDDHSCHFCGRKFNSSTGLIKHVRLTHGKRFGIGCPLCPEMDFEAKRYLHRHLFDKHKDEPESVIKKLQEETGLFLRRCSWSGCGVLFMRQGDEDKHMAKGVHGGVEERKTEAEKLKSHKCKYCGRKFGDNWNCRRHERIHETKGKVQVRQKNTGGKKAVVRVKHYKTRNFKCDICGERFGWARKWSDHLSTVHDKRELTCPGLECGKIFKDDQLADFVEHWKTRHYVTCASKKRRRVKNEDVKDNLLCTDCGRIFISQSGLRRHKRVIHEKRFTTNCSLCGLGFDSEKKLQRHLLGKHKDDKVTKKLMEETGLFLRKCKVVGCSFRFMKTEEENRHMERIHGGRGANEKRYKCKYCGRGFWDGSKCRRHERIHEEKGKVREITRNKGGGGVRKWVVEEGDLNKTFRCEMCSRGFRWARNWSDHLWNKHEKREITCPGLECGRIFRDDLVEFQKHWKKCHRPGAIRNGKGNRKKSDKGGGDGKKLSLSKNVNVGEYVCGVCGKGCISQKTLWLHKSRVHRLGRNDLPVRPKRKKGGKSSGKALCNLCGKELKSVDNLKIHVKYVHNKEFELSCHLCGLGMVSRGHLNQHLLAVHADDEGVKLLEEEEGIKLIRCGVVGCGATYLREEALEKHVERVHKGGGGGEHRFRCKYCGKGFWMGFRLKRHEEMHEGKGRKDWKCGICGKGFGTKGYLRYHELWTHKLSKKFEKKS